MDWVYYIVLVALLFCGIMLNVFTLPGNWLMLLAAVLFGWVTGWIHVGKWSLLTLFALATIGEIIEFAAAGKAASGVGGSKRGAAGAIVGGIIGGIVLTPLLAFIPILGTLVGILIGTFIGAAVTERLVGRDYQSSITIGLGATKGRLYGTLLKLGIGVIMLVVAMVAALPL